MADSEYSGVIARFATGLLQGEPLTVFGDGGGQAPDGPRQGVAAAGGVDAHGRVSHLGSG